MDVTEEIAALLPSLRGSRGVLVAARAGSEGAVSDLMPGDVIYSLNNRRVATLGDLRIALAGMKPGDAVVLQVERGGELIFLPFEADW